MPAILEILSLVGPFFKKALFTYWREFLILFLVLFIGYQNTFEHRVLLFVDTIPYLQKQLDESSTKLKECEAGNKNLSNSIDVQNHAILQWKETSDKLEAANARLVTEIDQMHKNTLTQVSTILNGKTPKTCAESMNYLRDSLGDLKWPK